MISRAAATARVLERKALDKGLIFIKEADILLSGDKWTIVVNIALDYTTLVGNIKIILK
jgi:hypothetical protein